MATLKPLLALKSSALKSLAVSLGVNSSGTKSQLASQIASVCCETVPFFERFQLEGQPNCEETQEAKLDLVALDIGRRVGKGKREKRKDKRVLSIDMGIRNLAMCVLEVPGSGLKRPGTKRKKGKVTESLPKILAWERVAIAKKPVAEEVEGPLSAPPEEKDAPPGETILGSKRKSRSKKGKKVMEVPPPGGGSGALEQEGVPSGEAKSNGKQKEKEVIEEPPPEEQGVPGQEEVPPKQITPKKRGRPRKVAEVTEEPPHKKEKEALKEEGKNEMTEAKLQGVLVGEEAPSEETTPETPPPSEEQEVLELKQIRSQESIGESKSRPRKKIKAAEAPLPEEQNPAKQAEVPADEATPGSKSRSRKSRKVTEAQFEELVLPITALDLDLGADEPSKKGGRVKRKLKRKPESFEPSVYALLANTFVRHLLTRFSPLDAVLIERQRYRSHGATAIQEWTVRVNMFEAMLHAVFRCLHGKKSPAAESVSPSRVTRFWVDRVGGKFLEAKKKPERRKKKEVLGEELGEELGVEGVEVVVEREKTYRKTKLAKVSLVMEWLRSGDVVSLGEEVKAVAADFEPVKGRRKSKRVTEGKLDDLADCLLQGMAWIRWEENRKSLAEGKLIPEFIPCANSKS